MGISNRSRKSTDRIYDGALGLPLYDCAFGARIYTGVALSALISTVDLIDRCLPDYIKSRVDRANIGTSPTSCTSVSYLPYHLRFTSISNSEESTAVERIFLPFKLRGSE